jgi:1-acyl-sn-glycerol-3-phosphate acyltransferase
MREWCFAGSRLYFKKVETTYIEPLPRDKPIIFVGNHCNTFIDPILISVNTRLYPAFLTTAAAFKNPVVAKFLHAIRMLPIYRQRDGGDTIQKNKEIFDISIKQLEANLQFVIFAEGSHSPFRRLRDFKKGFARIGFGALEQNEGDLDVYIVPVGVEYRQFGKMHQEVTQTFGKPILVKDYWEDYQKDKEGTLNKLKNHVYNDLKDLLIHIPTEIHYEAVESLRNIVRPWLYDFLGYKNPKLHDMLLAEKQMIAAQTSFEKEQPEAMDAFAQKIQIYQDTLDQYNFRNHLVANGLSLELV